MKKKLLSTTFLTLAFFTGIATNAFGVETLALSVIASLGVASVAVSNILYLGIVGALYIGASVGLSALSALFIPKPRAPKPEDVQQSTRQNLAPRYRHYGRVKASGSWAFGGSKEGSFYKVLAIGQGPIDAFEEYWVDDNQVTLGTDRYVLEDKYITGAGNKKVRIESRIGSNNTSHYSFLTSKFPEWTSEHKGNGITSLFVVQNSVKAEDYMKMFPNGIQTNYRVVMRASLVENPYTLARAWDDNASSIIRDYLYHRDGMRLPKSILTKPLAAAGWQAAFTQCDTIYNLKDGGTESRYRLWGSYSLEERPADVLNRMLVACDGRLQITPDGGLTLDIGDVPANPVILDDSVIVGFSELGRGRDILSTANTIRSTFLYPAADYQSAEAEPWVDEEDVALRGEIVQDQEFIMSPSHSQTRRLMKIASYKANPNWIATFNCNLKGLAAFGERFVRVVYPAFGIDEIFEVQDFAFDIGENGILTTVTITVSSLPAAAYTWNPATEEGDAPVIEEDSSGDGIPLPTNFNATIQRKTINGAKYPYAKLTFDPAPEGLITQARYKETSSAAWLNISVAEDAGVAESPILDDNAEYEFQVRRKSVSEGAWTASIVLTAVADTAAPGPITNLVVTPGSTGSASINMSWQSPNSNNFAATNIYRNIVNDFAVASLIHTEYGAANFPFTYTDSPLANGTYYYWFRSRNFSGIQGTAVPSGAKTVT